MKKLYFFILSIICSTSIFPQSSVIDWAKAKETPARSKGLLADINNNVYQYGCNFPDDMDEADSYYDNVLGDTAGSFLQQYSADGQLLLDKRWPGAFFGITKIVYDGSQSFYFTGLFTGTKVIDGITISSRGGADGMVGKIDMNGIIQWITTFGASGEERGESITINTATNTLAITGSTTDSLYVGNTFITQAMQSTLVASFSTSGAFQSHKLYDFVSSRNDGNFGKEIAYSAASNNYYVLTDREGYHWNGDTINAPLHGRYLMKLDQNFDTLWTKYTIGPSCYYGFSGKPLTIGASGDPYLINYCSDHYGGTGSLIRKNAATGSTSWSDAHTDGGYTDFYMDGNTVYTVGTEGAFYCPCPESTQGYQIVKTTDQNSMVIDSLKIEGYYIGLSNITRNSAGQTFITGEFSDSQYAVIGNDTVYSAPPIDGFYRTFFIARIGSGLSTGITNHENEQEFSILPNPGNGIINVVFKKRAIQTTCSIYDVVGNCIIKKQLNNADSYQFDLSAYAKGVYFVYVQPANGSKQNIKKVVIQ